MKTSIKVGLGLVIAFAFIPLIASAQSSLAETIRKEILKDPRASTISSTQLDAMVASLAQAAEAEGVTEADISWRPAEVGAETVVPEECDFFCRVNSIFGFAGEDYTIPIGLGVTSALLILFISMMLHRHHVHGVHPTVDAIHTMPAEAPKK